MLGLYDLHNLSTHIGIYIIGHRNSIVSIFHHLHSHVYSLKDFLLGDSCQYEAAFVQSFRSFGTGADTDSREWFSYGCKEGTFFRQCTGIGDYGKCIHLKVVVIMEA